MRFLPPILLLLLTSSACAPPQPDPQGSDAGEPSADAGDDDAGAPPADAGDDGGPPGDGGGIDVDGGAFDGGAFDGGAFDGGAFDGGAFDGGVADGGALPGMISEVLTCASNMGVGGLPPGDELQRHDVDLDAFPDALCNDGTGAVFYFAPYTADASRNRWIIQLQGGGACRSGDNCAERWCSVDTNFSAKQMTSVVAPQNGIGTNGILDETRADNPFATWNRVLVRYCSSDAWAGAARDVVVNAADPVTGEPRTFRLHFLGARIFDAVVDTLRQDGVAGLVYGADAEARALPDLDEATDVMLVGASAGGTGTIQNLDRLAETLRVSNVACQGGAACPLNVRGLIDSIFAPALEDVSWETSRMCTAPDVEQSFCSWEAFQQHDVVSGGYALQETRSDDSCVPWHAANAPGTEWQCGDANHIVRHHITTPLFVRMGQSDQLLSSNYAENGFVADEADFISRVRTDLLALSNAQSTAHEGSEMAVLPGVFGPPCSKHETLGNSPDTFDTAITKGGVTYDMVDVLQAWATGTGVTQVVAEPDSGDTASCP